MKKSLFTLMVIALMAIFAVSFVACDDQPTPNNTEQPGEEGEGEGEGEGEENGNDEGDESTNGIGVPQDIPTPINWKVEKADATDDGVSIEVTAIENNNFKCVVRPGANVGSYRLDIFPLSRLYNSLYEQMRSEGMDPATEVASEEQIEEWILNYVFNSSNAGAYIFSSDSLGDEFFNKEFDWSHSGYNQIKIVPNCEYVIAAVGCFDTEGSESQAGDLSICYVKTTADELVGNPNVDIQVETTYTAMKVVHQPNEDTHYLYHWCSNEADLVPYIETYGTKQYIDFLRNTVYTAPPADDAANLSYYVNFGTATDVKIMATVVGCDVNETPATDFQSTVFTLKERPEDRLPAEATIAVNPDKVGASIIEVDYTIERNTWAMFFNVMTARAAAEYSDATDEELATLAWGLRTEGWGVKNTNYRYDIDEDELWGDSFTGSEIMMYDILPDTEYVIVYTAENQYADLAPVSFSAPFKTKPLVVDAPETCEAELELEMSALGVNGVKTDFTFDSEKLAIMHFAFIQGDIAFTVPEDASREDLINATYYSTTIDDGDSLANHWPASESGFDSYSWYGFTPNTRYVVAYVAEDWNGVLGEVKLAEASTEALTGGPNPSVSLTPVQNEETGDWYFQFETNEDCYMLYYAVVSQSQYDQTLIGKDGSYKYWYGNIYDFFVGESTYMDTYRQSFTIEIGSSDLYYMALAIGWGKDENGNDVASKMYTLFYNTNEGTFKSLEEIYPTATHYTALKPTQQSTPMMMLNEATESSIMKAADMQAPALAPVKVDLNEWLDENDNKGVEYVFIDMKELAAHPNCQM